MDAALFARDPKDRIVLSGGPADQNGGAGIEPLLQGSQRDCRRGAAQLLFESLVFGLQRGIRRGGDLGAKRPQPRDVFGLLRPFEKRKLLLHGARARSLDQPEQGVQIRRAGLDHVPDCRVVNIALGGEKVVAQRSGLQSRTHGFNDGDGIEVITHVRIHLTQCEQRLPLFLR